MTVRQQSYRIEPGQSLSGDITVPGDKSISHRSVMLGSIASGQTTVSGFLESEDCLATLHAFEQMGVKYERPDNNSLVIHGVGRNGLKSPSQALDLGNSGTSMRLLIGLLGGLGVEATLTGDESLCRRPMERVAAPVRDMGATIATDDGCAPIRLGANQGLRGIRYQLPVASAQIKSALLFAGLSAEGRTETRAPAPSRDHSERMLKAMGAPVTVSEDGLVVSLDGPVDLKGIAVEVPADLSSAAFFIVGACLGAAEPVLIRNVGVNPTRDGILAALRLMGARIELENQAMHGAEPVADIRVYPSQLTGIELPEHLVPLAIDELPVLFVAAAAANGRTTVSGAAELRVKESDRIGAMARALAAVGVSVSEQTDGLIIDGGSIRGGSVDSAGDHRIAMAFSIAALVSDGPIEIADTGPVSTSFPGFVETAGQLGLRIDVTDG